MLGPVRFANNLDEILMQSLSKWPCSGIFQNMISFSAALTEDIPFESII